MAKINNQEAPEAITKIQLLTKTSTEATTPLTIIQLDQGEPLFDSNTNKLHIGKPGKSTGDKETTFMPMKKADVYEISDNDALSIAGTASGSNLAINFGTRTISDCNQLYVGTISADTDSSNISITDSVHLKGDNGLIILSADESGSNTIFSKTSNNNAVRNLTITAKDLSIQVNTATINGTLNGVAIGTSNISGAAKFNGAAINGTTFNGATINNGNITASSLKSTGTIQGNSIELGPKNSTGGYIDFHLDANKDNNGRFWLDSNGVFRFSNAVTVSDDSGNYKKITAGTFNAMSDMRLKENFQPLKPEKSILDLPTYKFDFINGAKNQVGCKAQDLQEICPEIVNEDANGMLSIQESKIVYFLLEEVKKLRKEVDDLKEYK